MNKLHRQIIEEINKSPRTKLRHHDSTYSGSPRPSYGLSVPTTRALSKKWAKNHQDLSPEQLLELVSSLYSGKSQEERSIAGQLLQYLPQLRTQIEPKFIDSWLNQLEGWGEIDGLCQSVFSAKDILNNWPQWNHLLKSLVSSSNISKRRASLVLLTGAVVQSNDKRLSNIAFANIDKLKNERYILITKAMSWLLRDLVKHHQAEVWSYLEKNHTYLPKIAVREVNNKIKTGKK